jgi:hypothetical protein
MNLNLLHDSILLKISAAWEFGDLEIEFKTCEMPSRTAILKFDNFKNFECTREFSWGKSISVNSVEVLENKFCELCIEMQSGDKLLVKSKSYKFDIF